MTRSKNIFDSIVKEMETLDNVAPGPMMSSPGLRYKEKVFAFFYNENMCFRLGDRFDLGKYGINSFELLNPFKNKGPLKGWFVIDEMYSDAWKNLSDEALLQIQKTMDK